MKNLSISFLSGILFAIGLSISGMTNPEKVRGFLDIFGNWDMSLAFVMIGAIGVNFFTFKKIVKKKPLCAESHSIPTKTAIDKKLLIGSGLFGSGWALMGICPGPGIVNLVTLKPNAILFIVAMTVGMLLFRLVEKRIKL